MTYTEFFESIDRLGKQHNLGIFMHGGAMLIDLGGAVDFFKPADACYQFQDSLSIPKDWQQRYDHFVQVLPELLKELRIKEMTAALTKEEL